MVRSASHERVANSNTSSASIKKFIQDKLSHDLEVTKTALHGKDPTALVNKLLNDELMLSLLESFVENANSSVMEAYVENCEVGATEKYVLTESREAAEFFEKLFLFYKEMPQSSITPLDMVTAIMLWIADFIAFTIKKKEIDDLLLESAARDQPGVTNYLRGRKLEPPGLSKDGKKFSAVPVKKREKDDE